MMQLAEVMPHDGFKIIEDSGKEVLIIRRGERIEVRDKHTADFKLVKSTSVDSLLASIAPSGKLYIQKIPL
jgi:hypothetical protein